MYFFDKSKKITEYLYDFKYDNYILGKIGRDFLLFINVTILLKMFIAIDIRKCYCY